MRFDLIGNFLFCFIRRERPRFDNSGEMQNGKAVGRLYRITVRLLWRQFERDLIRLGIRFQFRVGRRRSEFAGCFDWQLKLRRDLMKIGAFLQERLREIIGTVSQLLKGVDPLLVFQFLLIVVQRQPDKLYFPFFFSFEFAFVRFVIFLDVVIAHFDLFEKISGMDAHEADNIFTVKLFVIGFALAFRNRYARRDDFLDPFQAKLIMGELAQLLVGKSE